MGTGVALSRERQRLLGRLKRRRTREREGLFLVEGIRSAAEALSAGAEVRFAVLSPRLDTLAGGAELRERLTSSGIETVEVADAGLAVLGGLPMLIHQGALAFELWTGRPAPLDAMREAARAALAGSGNAP